jgi:hypothetical protein
MTDYSYRPRFGYDIRVRPPEEGGGAASYWTAPAERCCDVEGCPRRASVQAALSPRKMDSKIWLCGEHAKEHNARWNFFDGMSSSEAEAVRTSQLYGERPTWSLGRNDRARASAKARRPADFNDAFTVFRESARRAPPAQATRNGRPVTRLQARAFQTLDLDTSAPPTDIRKRYAELLKRYHPDVNGGDRGAEAQLQEVIKAHQLLKKSGFC